MKPRHFQVGAAGVLVVAVALRLGPLLQSPLPFNPDGVVYAGTVAAALERGSLPLARMAVDELHFASLLAVVSHATGRSALSIAQPALAVVGAVPALLVVAAGRRLAAAADVSWIRGVGLLAGGLLAVEGLYLHRSMPVDEQTVGLLLVPVAAYALARCWTDRRWGVVLAVALVALPVVHNLDSAVAGVLVVAAALHYAVRGRRRGALALGVGGLLYWLYVAGYSLGVAAHTPASIVQNARITDVPGLFVAWVILVAFGSAWFVSLSARRQRQLLAAGFGSWFVLLGVNAVVPVFPGMPTTTTLVLVGVACLLVPAAVAAYGAPAAARTRFGVPFTAQVAAVFGFVGVSLTAALTPAYVNTLYRVQTFVHLPAMAFAAVGVAMVASRRGWRPSSGKTRVLAAVVVVAAAASIPVAFAGLDALAYKGVTTEAEFEAASFATTHVAGEWAADDHAGRIARYHGPDAGGQVLPVYEWIHGGAQPPGCPVVSQQSWTTTGGQFYPKPPVAVSTGVYESFVDTRNVVYSSSSRDALVVTTPVSGVESAC